MGALEAGQAFLNSILEKIPAEHRDAAAAAFANANDAVAELGNGYLRQQDYSRQTQAARKLYDDNVAWHQANKALLDNAAAVAEENERLKAIAEGRTTPTPTPSPTPTATDPGYLKADDAQGIVNELLGMTVVMPALLAQHHARFGEWLDDATLSKLVVDAQQGKRSVKDQYALTFSERLAAKAAEEEAAKVARFKQEGVQEYLRAHPQMPYPVRPQAGPSPLDAITTPVDKAQNTPEAWAAEYTGLVASKAQAPA